MTERSCSEDYLKSVLGSDSSSAIPDLLKPLPSEDSSNDAHRGQQPQQQQPQINFMRQREAENDDKNMQAQHAQHTQLLNDPGNGQLATIDQNQGELIPMTRGQGRNFAFTNQPGLMMHSKETPEM
ncbi:hypothetical protein PROFUN_10871 [Planoprotostelium fungivorum]|uniref:Uncharacterized protein n=1 Tax=Planoprotostelium fungivorum TaxID=1890364 RepID=A0A2P6NC25_9EUKA|nr:hypothetical protein PROFUN_10871 [Planoprotostelium fungivorum]